MPRLGIVGEVSGLAHHPHVLPTNAVLMDAVVIGAATKRATKKERR